jgi:cyclopropane fatty-acyl-phospholipid synthase-like methyltransferase
MPESITGSMLDWVNRFLQRHDLKRYVPFTGNLQVRRPSFQAAGEQYLKMFIELGGLEPDERVLDIGCGPGRMAVPLATYLSPAGSYVGMDVVKSCVKGCRKRISPGAPNFSFEHMDVFNSRYKRDGSAPASTYRVPFEDASFDFIILISVFTHMLKDDTFHYIKRDREAARSGRQLLRDVLPLRPREARARQGAREGPEVPVRRSQRHPHREEGRARVRGRLSQRGTPGARARRRPSGADCVTGVLGRRGQ